MIHLINEDVLKVDYSSLPRPNLIVTSPPYNIGIEYDKHNDTMTYPEYLKWGKQWLTKMYDFLEDDGRICINVPLTTSPKHLNKTKGVDDINYPVVADYTQLCQKIGFKYWRTLIWEKMMSNSQTTWGSWRSASAPFMRDPSEAILIFYKKNWKRKIKGTSTISGKDFMAFTKNVWKIHPETKSKHPAAFPLELPMRCIKLLSYKEDVVCDPFMGSGTSGEAAVREGRRFVGIDKSAEYFSWAKDRIETAETQTSIASKFMKTIVDIKDDLDEQW